MQNETKILLVEDEVMTRDTTKRKQAEHALWLSEERLRSILNSIGDAVISTDAEGNIEWMNPMAEALTGWKLDECAGRPLSGVFRIFNSKTEEPVESPVKRVLESGEVVGLANHTMLVSRDGEKLQIADSGAPLLDDEGRPLGVVMVFKDVTEEYRLQKELVAREKELLLREVHHRIKNDMATIQGVLELQSGMIEEPEIKSRFSSAINRINIMSMVYRQLYQGTDIREMPLKKYLEALVGNLRLVLRTDTDVIIATEIEDITIPSGSAFNIGMIINELTSNSFKYAFGGTKSGRVNVVVRTGKDDSLEIVVSDDGCGMPARTVKEKDFGFGLTMVELMVERYHGSFDVTVEEGTTFRIVLRLDK